MWIYKDVCWSKTTFKIIFVEYSEKFEVIRNISVTLKVRPLIILYQPTTSYTDVDSMAVETEPSNNNS